MEVLVTQNFLTHEISIFLLLVMLSWTTEDWKIYPVWPNTLIIYLQMESYFGLIAKNVLDTIKYKEWA